MQIDFQNTGLFDSGKLIKFPIKIQASCQVLDKGPRFSSPVLRPAIPST